MSEVSTEEATPRHVIAALRGGSYSAARVVARGWHGGSDHNITGLSHGREWSSFGLVEEIELLWLDQRRIEAPKHVLDELLVFKSWAERYTGIHHVQSGHGHHFLDHDGMSECLTCGGSWELVHDDAKHVGHGRYRASNGDDPVECTGLLLPHEQNDECNCQVCR